MRILIVEDQVRIRDSIQERLLQEGMQVTCAVHGMDGYQKASSEHFDLVISDVMMPLMTGVEMVSRLRQDQVAVPILLLTGMGEVEQKIAGLEAGADDYLTKPFSMEEFILRIEAVLRRSMGVEPKQEEPDQYVVGGSTFEPRKQVLRTPVSERKLTTKESELLRLLCANRDQVVERSQALNEVWDNDSYFSGRSMDVYIAKLRKYLREDPALEIINVHGKGFRLITNASSH